MDKKEAKKYPQLTEEEIQETTDFAETEFYNTAKGIWKRSIAYFGLAQVIGVVIAVIIGVVIKYGKIEMTFPTFDIRIPSIELSSISIVMFQATVTVSGIILGFCAVCVFSMLEWSERIIERYTERIEKSKNKEKKNHLVFEQIVIKGVSNGLSKYATLFFQEVSIPLLITNVFFFFLCWVSGLFLIPSILLNMNSVSVISSGIYPVIRSVFWFRLEEMKEIV